MCQQHGFGVSFRDLEKCGAINIQKLADAALNIFNLAIDMESNIPPITVKPI